MEVKVCRRCRKIFQHIVGPEICPQCKQFEEVLFVRVKDYLRENPGANIYQIHQETTVSAAMIERFLRQGRLQVAPDSPIALGCERCGNKISTGRYCGPCASEVTAELNQAKQEMSDELKKNVQDDSAKMRFLKV